MDFSDPTTRRQFLELATVMAGGLALAGGAQPAGATPPAGNVTRTPLAQGRLDETIDISTSGPTDFHIHHVVLDPGADSGWHTHPGTALDILVAGTATLYLQGVDCEPRRFEAGQAVFVPAGIAHLARNEGSVPAEIYVTYLVAAGAEPRDDSEVPANCTP